jgi:List-Bact-rpt repeat protein
VHVGLLAFALGLCLAPAAAARALHFNVVVTVVGNGTVSAYFPSGQIICPDRCNGLVTENSNLTLTAEPAGGLAFGGWGGDCAPSGKDPKCVLFIDHEKSISASFTDAPPPPPPTFNFAVTKAGSGTGYVGGGGGIDCGPVCAVSDGAGAKFQLVALADVGSRFAGWGGVCSGTAPCNVTLTAAASVTATFERLPLTLKALASAGLRGEVSKLRYRLGNPPRGHREGMLVLKGKHVVDQIAKAHTRLANGTYSIPWRVPSTLAPGVLSFCIVVIDPTSSKRPKSCAPLRIV